ncbi:MAG: hypothetical protein JKY88_05890 [Pseudomonadales bacterium]|nr:hypothetical protein [Pseudomonadales bacterium]
MVTILDPTNEHQPVKRDLATRHSNIVGHMALLDISKPKGSIFLDKLETLLAIELPDVTITRYSKPTFAKPAPEALREKIKSKNDFVIEALAD